MLVLSRKPGESLDIGNGIQVKIVKVNGKRVVLGITADHEVKVRRSEKADEPDRKPKVEQQS